jgi:hypothetical protein
MSRRGLLLTMTEPPAAMEEEFNAWYDTEHLPERLAIPGFRSARRWVADCAPGAGKYLATYELDSAAVLESAEYLAHVGEQFTPWSKRCLSKAVVFRRWACEQLEPGDTDPDPKARALLLACGDEAAVELPSARRFAALTGEPRRIHLLELADPRAAPKDLVSPPGWLVRLYRAYPAPP